MMDKMNKKCKSGKQVSIRVRIGLLLGLLVSGSSLFALNEQLSLHVWCEVSPFRWEIEKPPVDEKEAVKQILAEARVILSGMLYGYTFLYTPSDKARGVKEVFELEPVREIPWGDPRLSVAYYEQKENQLNARVLYALTEAQGARLAAWQSNTIPVASGRGNFSLFEGENAKLNSVKEAVKQAIRIYLRPREQNKPREISGEVLIWNEPRTVIIDGDYVTTLKTKLFIKNIEAYKVF
jgi:hypothetical protein